MSPTRMLTVIMAVPERALNDCVHVGDQLDSSESLDLVWSANGRPAEAAHIVS